MSDNNDTIDGLFQTDDITSVLDSVNSIKTNIDDILVVFTTEGSRVNIIGTGMELFYLIGLLESAKTKAMEALGEAEDGCEKEK